LMIRATRLAMVCCLAVSAVSAAGGPDARLGFDGRCRVNVWTPVFVTVENRNAAVTGRVVIELLRDRATVLSRVTKRVELAAPARKRFVLYAQLTPEVSEVRVRTEFGSARVERVLIPELISGQEELQVAVFDERSEVAPRSQSFGEPGQAVHRAIIAPSSLPDRWIGYAGVRTVFLGDLNPQRLTPEQVDALRHWLSGGGELVVLHDRVAARARHSWLEALLPASGATTSFGLGQVALIDGTAMPKLARSDSRSGVPIVDWVAVRRALPSIRSVARSEWLIAGIVGCLAVMALGFVRTRPRVCAPVLALGATLVAVTSALAMMNSRASVAECTTLMTASGARLALARTLVAARAEGGRLDVVARPGAALTRANLQQALGTVEFAQDEVFALPRYRFGGEAPREFIAESVVDLNEGVRVERLGDRVVVVNRTPFVLRDYWLSGDAPGMSRGTVAEGGRTELKPARPASPTRWQRELRATLQQATPFALCAWIDLPPQVEVRARKQAHRSVSVLVIVLGDSTLRSE